jgi:ABC-2 type transport system ATP-binding protein
VLARSRLSVVPQRSNLDRALTARQNLVFHAAYHGVAKAERNRRADELLEQFGLEGRGADKVDNYSGGMAQRLLIARALMHGPQVLFLDEPSTGLDPQARLFVWERIRELRASGVTIVLTTHDMDEAAELTDRVGIMDHGKLLALDTPEALTRDLPGGATLDLTVASAADDTPGQIADALAGLRGVERVEQPGSERAEAMGGRGADGRESGGGREGGAIGDTRLRLYLHGEGAPYIPPVADLLARRQARLSSVVLGEPSLEDVFLTLTGRDLR